MSNSISFGEKSWDDAGGGGTSDFFNMKDNGQYTMRIVGKPHEFAAHWVDAPGVSGKKKVNCASKGCILCAKGQKSSIRYFVPVILREENARLAITEFGPQVYGHIRALFQNKNWGDPRGYDIMIDKNTARGAAGTYFVTPVAKSRFTEDETTNIKTFLDKINLKELSAPSDNNTILEKLGPDFCKALGLLEKQPEVEASGEFEDFSVGGDDEYNFDSVN